MSDYEELKKAAKLATPGPWGLDGPYICPVRIESGARYVESWRVAAKSDQPENAKYISMANPIVVSDLIAEIESLRKDAGRYRWLRQYEFDIGSFHSTHEHNHQAWFESMDDDQIDACILEEISQEQPK